MFSKNVPWFWQFKRNSTKYEKSPHGIMDQNLHQTQKLRSYYPIRKLTRSLQQTGNMYMCVVLRKLKSIFILYSSTAAETISEVICFSDQNSRIMFWSHLSAFSFAKMWAECDQNVSHNPKKTHMTSEFFKNIFCLWQEFRYRKQLTSTNVPNAVPGNIRMIAVLYLQGITTLINQIRVPNLFALVYFID